MLVLLTGNPLDALATEYGRLLAVKLALFLLLLGLAAFNKLRLTPALLADDAGAGIRLRQSIRLELAVVAPEHAGDNWRDGRYSGTSANWRRRPRQLSAALDHLLGDREFGPRIDAGRIGAIGHSAGGYSVLALIGGRADTSVLAGHCTRNRQQDREFCAYGRPDGHYAKTRRTIATTNAPMTPIIHFISALTVYWPSWTAPSTGEISSLAPRRRGAVSEPHSSPR